MYTIVSKTGLCFFAQTLLPYCQNCKLLDLQPTHISEQHETDLKVLNKTCLLLVLCKMRCAFPNPNVQVVLGHVLVWQKCCRVAVGRFPRSFLKGMLGIQEWLRKGVAVIAFPLWHLAAGVEGSIGITTGEEREEALSSAIAMISARTNFVVSQYLFVVAEFVGHLRASILSFSCLRRFCCRCP